MKKRKILSVLAFGSFAFSLVSCGSKSILSTLDTNHSTQQQEVIDHSNDKKEEEETGFTGFGATLNAVNDEPILKLQQEKISQGLENLNLDTGWQNVTTSYSVKHTYGKTSKGSLKAVVDQSSSKHWKMKRYISFNTDPSTNVIAKEGIDFTKGILTFDYLPVNISNPDSLLIFAIDSDWNTIAATGVVCEATENGWYRCVVDLSNLGIEKSVIRLNIGFDCADEDVSSAVLYVDNMKIHSEDNEGDEKGLDNHTIDTGMSKCSSENDYVHTASEASSYSHKITWKSVAYDWQNKNMYCINTQNIGLTIKNSVVEAKIKFSEGFPNNQIMLVLVDANWKACRIIITPEAIENGWYLLKCDLADALSKAKSSDPGFDTSTNLIRLGFGFNAISADNKNDLTAWIDEVYIAPSKNVAAATNINVWQGYSTENILQSETISGRSVTDDAPLYIEDARNSTESTQLMLTPSVAVSSFDFRVNTLYNNSGGSLGASNFEVLVAKYVYIDGKSIEENKEGWKGAGYYPDALVPIENIKAASENNIASGNTQGIWINCTIPENQVAGDYTGFGVLTIDGVEYKVPIKVKVHNATLSSGNHNKTCFLTWDDQIDIGEGFIDNDLRREYFINGLQKGICSGSLHYLNNGTYTEFADKFADYIANDNRINMYRIPVSKDSNGNVVEADVAEYLEALINKNIEVWNEGNHVNFFDKLYFYINDEPLTPNGDDSQKSDSNQKSKEQWACVLNNNTIINKYKQSLASKLADYPELAASFADLRNLLPMDVAADKISGDKYHYGFLNLGTDYYPNYFNTTYMETPCPAYHHLTDATVRAKYASTFKHTWFYGCLLPQLPYAGYHIDNHLIKQRAVTWMQYDYNFEGNVYWCTNFNQQDSSSGWVDRDVWNDPYSCGCCCGDGQLSYPGKKYGIFGPITSQRYETLRNSMKDYEYFYTFDSNIENYKSKTGKTVANCREHLATTFAEMFNSTTALATSYTSQMFENVRVMLLNDLDSGF